MSGLVMAGGYERSSVEMFVPSSGYHCHLPDLPQERYYHTMEGLTVCGGGTSQTSCLSLTNGTWQTSASLLERRYTSHSSN